MATKKIHRILARGCVQTLENIFRNGMVADRAVRELFAEHPKWGARDRAFVADTLYEVVRWRRRLSWLAGSSDDDWPALAGMHWALREYPRPDWADWPEISVIVREERETALVSAPRGVRQSLSDELDAIGERDLGERWEAELAALNRPAPVFLRVNPQRSSVAAAVAKLEEHGVEVVPIEGAPLGLRVVGEKAIAARLAASGAFEIQDAASQQVAPFLKVEPGDRVVDACAGAGGKTLHVAALMKGRGEVRALDVEERKLDILRSRASKAGVNVRAVRISPGVLAGMDSWADGVLIDAPCSGSGTLRRHPDLKYRITADSLERTQMLQRELLLNYSKLVRPGGKLVYATCSILPSENEAQMTWFSANMKDFNFEEHRRITPAETGWDGFYMARWRRNELR